MGPEYPDEYVDDPCPGCMYEEECNDPDICIIEELRKEADEAEIALQRMVA